MRRILAVLRRLRPGPVLILEAVLVGSLAAIGKGLFDIYPPAAFIAIGVIGLALVEQRMLWSRSTRKKP